MIKVLGVKDSGLASRVQGSCYRIWALGLRLQGYEFKNKDLGIGVRGFEFGASGLRVLSVG